MLPGGLACGWTCGVHRPKNAPPPFADLLTQLWAAGAPRSPGYLVAGQVTAGLVGPALMAGFGTVIVGGAVTEADHPASVWSAPLGGAAASRTPPGAPPSSPSRPP